jgi:exosortase A
MNSAACEELTPNGGPLAPAWRQASVALVLLIGWILFLYRDTGIAMVTIWSRSETFTHAFLVPPISLWLIWRQRSILLAQMPAPNSWALLVVSFVAFGWLLGDLVAVNAVTQLALVALLVLTVPAVLGMAITRMIVFPLGFLFFAVPIGEFLLPQLMTWTADFTVLALRLSGIPVYREGLQFVIPSGNWSVVEACSGVRYLIASLTVGTLFAYLNYQSIRRRVLFVIVSLVVPVLANWLRAYMIVMLGHLSGNKLATGVDHLVYGWLFFGIVIMLMFMIGARWSESEKLAEVKVGSACINNWPWSGPRFRVVSLVFTVLTGLPQIALWAIERSEVDGTVVLTAPKTLASDWQAEPAKTSGFKPTFQATSAEINSVYSRQGRVVELYVGYYYSQNYSRKLVSSNNALVLSNDVHWAHVTQNTKTLLIAGKPVAVRTAELRGSGTADQTSAKRLVVWQIYWINGILTTNDYLAKVYSAIYRLAGRGDDSAVIVISTPKSDQAAGAETVLESFLSINFPVIDELLHEARKSK